MTGPDASGQADGPVIDSRGGFIIPALWDAHSHPGTGGPRDLHVDAAGRIERITRSLRDAAKAGIVGVRVLGEALATDVYVRDNVEDLLGASMLLRVAGAAVKPVGGHGAVTIDPALPGGSMMCDQLGSFEAHDDESLVRAVDLLATHHRVDWIKIFASGGIAGENETYTDTHMSEEQIRIVCEAAAVRGISVAAHAGNPEAITRAVNAGVRSIEHGYELSVANAAAMAERGVWFVPTMSITHNEQRMATMGWSPSTINKAREMQEVHRASLGNARAAGVRIASGSDMRPIAGAAPEEVLMLAQCGFTPAEALQLATIEAADLCGASEISGSITAGKRADLTILADNPLEHLASIVRPITVVNKGVVL